MSAPPKLFVTGATGQLGRLVINALLEMVPASSIVAGVRDHAKEAAVALRGRGVEVRVADYSQPETLASALAGVDRLLLISGSEIGKRAVQHRNVIAAAKRAGVGLIIYTSILHANTSPLLLAKEHCDTETALAEAGVPYTLLRHGWYTEVFTWRLPLALKTDTFNGAAEDGRVSSAARADYAKAAAAVLAGGDHAGKTYELAGDDSFTLAELVAVVTEASGRPIAYQNMTAEDYRAESMKAGIPEMFAMVLSDTDAGIAKGSLFDNGGELARKADRATDHALQDHNYRVRSEPALGQPHWPRVGRPFLPLQPTGFPKAEGHRELSGSDCTMRSGLPAKERLSEARSFFERDRLKAAIRRVMGSTWQRCRVHWMRNAQSYVPKAQQNMVSAALRQAFIQPDRTNANQTLRHVADQLRGKWPKLGAFIDESEADVLAHMDFPASHRAKLHSTNPLERLSGTPRLVSWLTLGSLF